MNATAESRPSAPAPEPAPAPAPAALAPAASGAEPRVRFSPVGEVGPDDVEAPAPPTRISEEIEVVDESEIAELLNDSADEDVDVDLPKGRVTQDDLDRLFGGSA